MWRIRCECHPTYTSDLLLFVFSISYILIFVAKTTHDMFTMYIIIGLT